MTTSTTYSNQCAILTEFWQDYKGREDLSDFIEYNDLGLPMAFIINEGIVVSTPMAEAYIKETFDLLLTALSITDTGFENFVDMLEASEFGKKDQAE